MVHGRSLFPIVTSLIILHVSWATKKVGDKQTPTEGQKSLQCGTWTKYSDGGILTSPNYPNKYPPDRECIYIIEASPRQCIELHFDDKYAIESSWECKFDHIEVRDGPFGFSPIIGRYCGQQSPPFIKSSGRFLWIKFFADGELESLGFSAQYNFTPDPDFKDLGVLKPLPVCEFEMGGPEGIIESVQIVKEGKAAADEAVDCKWYIRAPPKSKIYLRFLDYEMQNSNECKRNFVAVYDGSSSVEDLKAKFCSTVANDVMLRTGLGVIRMWADEGSRTSRFQMLFTSFQEQKAFDLVQWRFLENRKIGFDPKRLKEMTVLYKGLAVGIKVNGILSAPLRNGNHHGCQLSPTYRICHLIINLITTITCADEEAPCEANSFFCHSNMCINNTLVCNGVQNCVYPWDENHCKEKRKMNLLDQLTNTGGTVIGVSSCIVIILIIISVIVQIKQPRKKFVQRKADYDQTVFQEVFEPPHYELCTLRGTEAEADIADITEDFENYHKLRRSSSKCIHDHHCGSLSSAKGSRCNLSTREPTLLTDTPKLPEKPSLQPMNRRNILVMKHSYSQEAADTCDIDEIEEVPTTSHRLSRHDKSVQRETLCNLRILRGITSRKRGHFFATPEEKRVFSLEYDHLHLQRVDCSKLISQPCYKA